MSPLAGAIATLPRKKGFASGGPIAWRRETILPHTSHSLPAVAGHSSHVTALVFAL
jgi:hypothetical protein